VSCEDKCVETPLDLHELLAAPFVARSLRPEFSQRFIFAPFVVVSIMVCLNTLLPAVLVAARSVYGSALPATSSTSGTTLPDYGAPQSLGTSTMNAPVKDCAGNAAFLGSILFSQGDFDPSRCAAACNAKTKCAAFGTYILTTTAKNGQATVQGQKCTFYTSYWDASKYAKNTGTFNDKAGTKNTYTSSYFYSRADRQPICPGTCVAPAVVPGYKDFTPIYGTWENGEIGINPNPEYDSSVDITLPFPVGISGQISRTVSVHTDGYLEIALTQLYALRGQSGGLYVYSGPPNGDNGIFYRVAGDVGSRTAVFSWYAGTEYYGSQQNHFTITLFENRPYYVQYKYYDIILDPPYPNALVGVAVNDAVTEFQSSDTVIANGTQISIYAPVAGSIQFRKSSFDRIDCCTTSTFHHWHVCAEFQPPVADSLAPAPI
jgi:hypothetical protein